MEKSMGNRQNLFKKSLLICNKVDIPDSKISIRIPTVREILEDEETYYSIISSLTAVPYQYMVQLNDVFNIDFTAINDYQLFTMLFPMFTKTDLSIIFGDLYTADYKPMVDPSNLTVVINSAYNGNDYQINEITYGYIVKVPRKINGLERFKYKPGNQAAKDYLLDKERRKQKRNANKPYEPYLEKLVIALCNSPEFKYNYEETMDLSIYKFNQSFKQIQTRVTFDNTMIGVYSGTVDTSKMSDRSCLSWLQLK